MNGEGARAQALMLPKAFVEATEGGDGGWETAGRLREEGGWAGLCSVGCLSVPPAREGADGGQERR